jgi:hypothetical protein
LISSKIEEILRALNVANIKTTGDKVRSSCPLAPWKHSGGHDNNPSFAVWIKETDLSPFKCMSASCGFRGTLQDLVTKVQAKSGNDLSGLLLFVSNNDSQDNGTRLEKLKHNACLYSVPREVGFWQNPDAPDFDDPLVMTKFAPALPADDRVKADKMIELLDDEALWYLHIERGFDDVSIKKWQLGWHPIVRRISIPQFDRHGRLVNMGGRHVKSAFDTWDPPKWMHSKNFKKELYLFGEDKFIVSPDGKGTMFLVEGMFDAIYLDMKGIPNVGAMCGSYLSKIQCEKVVRWFDNLVIVPDGDTPGREAADRIMKSIGSRINTYVYNTPEGKDPDQLTDEEINELKSRFLH